MTLCECCSSSSASREIHTHTRTHAHTHTRAYTHAYTCAYTYSHRHTISSHASSFLVACSPTEKLFDAQREVNDEKVSMSRVKTYSIANSSSVRFDLSTPTFSLHRHCRGPRCTSKMLASAPSASVKSSANVAPSIELVTKVREQINVNRETGTLSHEHPSRALSNLQSEGPLSLFEKLGTLHGGLTVGTLSFLHRRM
jgi:hypothetical protein